MDLLAVGSLVVLGYTFAGYPLLVALLARLRPWRVRANPAYEPTVSVCLTVYNGAPFLAAKLDSLLSLAYPHEKVEVLVYLDGGTDESAEIVRRYEAACPRVRHIRADWRRGKPYALNHLCKLAKGDVLLMTDVRQPISPRALPLLVAYLADPDVGCVSGNLELGGAAGSGVYWRYEKWIRQNEARFGGTVGVTGALYAIRRADFPVLPVDVLLDDLWIPMHVTLAGKRTAFCPQALAYDRAAGDPQEFARKARTLAGNYQLFLRWPRLLVPILNPAWFQTFSHKALRLLCPWALLGLLFASLATPALWSLAAVQVTLYLLAAVGPRGGRLSSLARTFVMLHLAALVGLWRFARGAQRVTW